MTDSNPPSLDVGHGGAHLPALNPSVHHGIVPPYMSKDWQTMRAHLRLVAAHATAAAEASTTEDVRKNIGAASVSLIDADFLRRTIEREERRHD